MEHPPRTANEISWTLSRLDLSVGLADLIEKTADMAVYVEDFESEDQPEIT